jgi:hypothetical protein
MNKPIKFLAAQAVILFVMILMIDFTFITKFMLWFLWSSWTIITSIMYAVIWRESVDCKCFEKESEE